MSDDKDPEPMTVDLEESTKAYEELQAKVAPTWERISQGMKAAAKDNSRRAFFGVKPDPDSPPADPARVAQIQSEHDQLVQMMREAGVPSLLPPLDAHEAVALAEITSTLEVEDQHPVVVARVSPKKAPLAVAQIQPGVVLEDTNGFKIRVVEINPELHTFTTEDCQVELPCLSVQRIWILEASIMTFFNIVPPKDPYGESESATEVGKDG